MNPILRNSVVAALAAMSLAQPAQAVLQRQGPVDPANGFPAWFQDRNGTAMELCSINSPDAVGLAVVNAGLCAIVNVPAPNGVSVAPEVFPTNFSTEHFYTLTSANLAPAGQGNLGNVAVPTPGAGRIVFNFALEGSFANGVPTAGQQLWFTRWRINHGNVACTGNHTYFTPTRAPQTFPGVARGKTFETTDTGMGNPAAVMSGDLGPFLQSSDVAGGAPRAPFVGPDGKKYLSDGGGVGSAITGSEIPNALATSTNPYVPPEIKAMKFNNYVAVQGPGVVTGNCALDEVVYSTNTFSLFGRFFEGPIPSRNSVDRATYRAVDTNADGKSDTFQIGAWAQATQEAGKPVPRLGVSLWYTDPALAASSTAEVLMEGKQTTAGTPAYVGQIATPEFEYFQGMTSVTQPTGTTALPNPVYTNARVRVITDTPPTTVDVALVDELRINQAVWNSVTKTLTVSAESGAYLQTPTPIGGTAANAICSTPCLTLNAYGLPLADAAGAAIDFKMKTAATATAPVASIVVPNVQTPPSYVTVRSTAGGSDRQPVIYQGSATGAALFQADTVSVPKDTPVNVDVFANDIGVAAVPNLLICADAAGVTCAVPNAQTACTLATPSPQCTGLGGRMMLTGNLVTYTPPAGVGGTTDTFWYKGATANGTTAVAQVNAVISNFAALPDARDDLGNTAVAGVAAIIDVVANDFAPAGVDLTTLRITQEPCTFTAVAPTCAAGSASFTTIPGKLVFTAPSPGNWTFAYTFTDLAGMIADQGVVGVNALGAETLSFARAIWTAGRAGTTTSTLRANGVSSIAQGQPIQLMLPNAASGVNGCTNPAAGQLLATTTVGALGVWVFAGVTLNVNVKPTQAYVYSPSFGGCTQTTVQ